MLKVTDVDFSYGKIQALRGISFEVPEGEICSIIGANGNGKSTLLKCIAGVLHPQKGRIEYNGQVLPAAAYAVIKKGIAIIPEGRWVFPQLSVIDNLQIGAYTVDKATARRNMQNVYERFPKLEARKHQRAGTLSGGEQQMLVVGRALMCNPKVLLMDEPSLGLAPMIINEIFRIIEDINKEGVTILLVEQNAKKALSISNKAFLLETGRIVKSGTGQELADDPDVIATYLGGRKRDAEEAGT